MESKSEILRQSDNDTPHSSDHSDVRTSTGDSYIAKYVAAYNYCVAAYNYCVAVLLA